MSDYISIDGQEERQVPPRFSRRNVLWASAVILSGLGLSYPVYKLAWPKSNPVEATTLLQGTTCSRAKPVQVFADVDDTFESSGGGGILGIAGCDDLYAEHVVYPGFTQLVLELSRTDEERTVVFNPAVMSARPTTAKALVGMETGGSDAFAMKGKGASDKQEDDWDALDVDMPLQGVDEVQARDYQDPQSKVPWGLNMGGSLYGSIEDGISHKSMGYTKFNNFKSYFYDAKEESCVVFMGDDGQGDCNPAAMKMRMWQSPSGELGLKAAFIHRVSCGGKRTCSPVSDGQGSPIFLFDTYLDAAGLALEHGFISSAGYLRVERSLRSFFDKFCSPGAWWWRSKFPHIVRDEGCMQLSEALDRSTLKLSHNVTDEVSRSLERSLAFCRQCCTVNGAQTRSNKADKFVIDWAGEKNIRFRCHDLYQSSRPWFSPHAFASDAACKRVCSTPIPDVPPGVH